MDNLSMPLLHGFDQASCESWLCRVEFPGKETLLANKLEMISKFFLHNNYMELNNSLLKKHWTETLEHVI